MSSINRSSNSIPTQIGRYEILRLLGQGGMGVVYQARDPHLNRDVVLKLINLPDPEKNDELQQRFRREVQAAGQFNHPHIVTVYDVNLEHEPLYVVMELLTGGNLKELLKNGPLPCREALILLRPLAEALAYAHRAGVIHRDVKPTNVMFGGIGVNELKLVDFGLARWQSGEQMTQVGTVMGTPAYMSPEQARGEVVDARTDIFSLGVILYEAIAGHNPLARNSPTSTLLETISDNEIDLTSLLNKAPQEVVRLVGRALVKNRDQRFPSCETLLADLDQCLGASAVVSTSSSSATYPSESAYSSGPDIRLAGDIDLDAEVELVLRTMFSTFSRIAVEAEFDRGFSGSHVFRIRLIDKDGRAQLPAVVKVAPVGLIRQEWEAYQAWVEHTLPNIARLELSPIYPSESLWGGLRYALVGSGTFTVQSLRDYYQETGIEDLLWVIERRLFEIMGPNWWLDNRTNRAFQMQADYDRLLPVNLLIRATNLPRDDNARIIEAGKKLSPPRISAGDRVRLLGFVVTRVEPRQQQVTLNLPPHPTGSSQNSYLVRLNDVPNISDYQVGNIIDVIQGEVIATRHDFLTSQIRQVLGEDFDLSAKRLFLSVDKSAPPPPSVPNPLLTYQDLLRDFITVNISTIHGDLNMENILIDPATREVSLIDFATVRQGHALHDLLRLETEVVIMLMPPILAEAGLPPETIYLFYEQLHRVTLYPAQGLWAKLPWTALEKPFMILQAIRRMARKCLFNSDDWQEYCHGLIIYLLGALKFENLQTLPTAPLPSQIAFWGAAAVQHLLEVPPAHKLQQPSKSATLNLISDEKLASDIESPFGTMRPDSKMYIVREVDGHCQERVSRTNAVTLFIQAPRQMGKSSLMRRVLEQARHTQHKPFAFIDFQKFPEQYFDDEEKFLIELCLMIGEALRLPEAIDRYWQGRRTNIMKCSRYLSNYIIPQVNESLILAMDEVERMLTCPFRANFFGMLRTWHNDRFYDENFAKLTLFLSSSTEPYLFIDNPNQSPFNVAEVFSLQDFTREEVEELNRRHGEPITKEKVGDMMDLIEGHPFLTRLALYLLATGKVVDLETLLAQAIEDTGPFGDHLHHYLLRVLQKPELKQALDHICRNHTYEEDQIFYRLKGAGLIKKKGKLVVLRNNLYDRYFKERLNV